MLPCPLPLAPCPLPRQARHRPHLRRGDADQRPASLPRLSAPRLQESAGAALSVCYAMASFGEWVVMRKRLGFLMSFAALLSSCGDGGGGGGSTIGPVTGGGGTGSTGGTGCTLRAR